MTLAHAENINRRTLERFRAFGGGHDYGQPAVGDQAAIEKIKRLDHPSRGIVIGHRHRRVMELRGGIEVGPIALRDRDRAELLLPVPYTFIWRWATKAYAALTPNCP